MKARFIFLLFFIISSSAFSQVPRTVLLEYATNASCGPCADHNPGNYNFLKSNYENMVSIWYHAWWPGSGDPMYVANKPENENRIGYYGINGVPNFVLNGLSTGGFITSDLISDATPLLNLESPVKLKVETKNESDSINVTVTLIVYGDVTQENIKLRTVVTEQMLLYSSPPGSNGEAEFPHVFRKFIGGVKGIDISGLNIGDSLTYSLKEEINEDWNLDVLAIVAFLQSESSKEVIQASVDKRFHEITGNIPSVEMVQKNVKTNHSFSITNAQIDALELVITLDVIENNQNWVANLLKDGNIVDSIFVSLATDESVSFELDLQTGDIPDYIRLTVSAKNSSDFTYKLNYLALVKAGDIILVDDDGEQNYETNFTRALINDNKDFTHIKHDILNELKADIDLTEFKSIIWNMGNETPTLASSDLNWLLVYLNGGGRVLLSGSDFAHDIHDVQRSSTGKSFFRNYLDVDYLTDSVTSKNLSSVHGNPLFDTLNIELNSLYSTLPDGVASRKGESHMIMQFDGTDNYGLILRERNNYKTAYITFGLEQISSEATQDLVVEKILDWFATPVVGVDENNETNLKPKQYNLEQNFPNPFNPSTIINFQLPKSGNVKIVVYDILGNEVAELLNENKNAGYHSVEFSSLSANREVTSGVYFYSISAGSFYQVKKMLLIK
jgi:outer membrane protein Omp28/type IX secretion system substrate protein